MMMKSLDIPDEIPDLAKWLDDLLVSPDLMDTIIELELLAEDKSSSGVTLAVALDEHEDQILHAGLESVGTPTIQYLLRNPALLLELQEKILMHGGNYWQRKVDARFNGDKSTLFQQIETTSETKAQLSKRLDSTDFAPPRSYAKRNLGIVAAIAASIFAVLMFLPGSNQVANVEPDASEAENDLENPIDNNKSVDWGFAESGLLELSVSEGQMLKRLYEASQAWYNQIPESSTQLEERLRQYDLGCEQLLASDLPQLSDVNRRAVHNACEDCRASIARQLAEIKAGTDFDIAVLNADNAINQLADTIQNLI